jgi:pimeloyl-ACP methyl ester carboxylesterase
MQWSKIEFPSEGATLRGRLYLPERLDKPARAVIMAHGTSGTIQMVADKYAEAFCRAGFAAVLYDHRNFGMSGGEPRLEINPWVQARGYRDAITYAAQLPEIDAEHIAIWGDSYTGGQVIVVAAVDKRVKAVVAQCPVCGSTPPPPDRDGSRFKLIQATLESGDVRGTAETTTGPMPVVSFDQIRHPSLLKPLSAYRWFIEYGGRHGSGWVNDATRVIPPTPAPWNAVICAAHVTVPTLIMVSPEDEMVHANPAVTRLAFDALAGPKQWYEIEEGHFGLLWYPGERFDEASGAQVDFLLANLPAA